MEVSLYRGEDTGRGWGVRGPDDKLWWKEFGNSSTDRFRNGIPQDTVTGKGVGVD